MPRLTPRAGRKKRADMRPPMVSPLQIRSFFFCQAETLSRDGRFAAGGNIHHLGTAKSAASSWSLLPAGLLSLPKTP